LDTLAGLVDVEIALSPRVDNCVTGEDSVTLSALDSDRTRCEIDIVDDESTARGGDAVGVEDSLDTDGCVGEGAVLKDDRANALIASVAR
jgi:hypothetical protein